MDEREILADLDEIQRVLSRMVGEILAALPQDKKRLFCDWNYLHTFSLRQKHSREGFVEAHRILRTYKAK